MRNPGHPELGHLARIAWGAALTVAALAFPSSSTAQADCGDWMEFAFWEVATADDVSRCHKEGRSAKERDYDGDTPLHLAAISSLEPAVVQALLDADGSIDIRNHYGQTPLMFVEHFPVALALIALGANVNARGHYNAAPLHYNVRNADVVRALIAAGADVNAVDNDLGFTALHEADKPEVIRELTAAGADVNARDFEGFTALHFAAWYGSPSRVQALLDAGADPSIKNNDGITPADYAKENERVLEHPVYQLLD